MIALLDEARLEQDVFRLLGELFRQHCGLVLGPETRTAVERRLRERLAHLGLASYGEYYRYLRFHEGGHAEMDEATDLVTINETYFFRENYQMTALKEEILPRLLPTMSPRHRVSVWSAGCSTGEEVYTIAIALRESGKLYGRPVRVFGSDISRRCVAAARRGVYGPSSFRATPPEVRARYFHPEEDGEHVVAELRDVCQFGHLNLVDADRAALVGRSDVIFCRNVLIYLDPAARRRVIEIFYERLRPGGFLLLGHSESLLNVSTAFELCHLHDDLVYRKPLTAERIGAALPPRSRRALG